MSDARHPLEYRRAGRRHGHPLLWGLAPLFVFVAIVFLVFPFGPPSGREAGNRVKCGINLRQLGIAMREYWVEHGEAPSDLHTLLNSAGLPSHVLMCPSDDGEPAAPGEPLTYGVTVSYVILNDALTGTGNPHVVVAIESPAIHEGDGSNVLYADATVRFSRADEVADLCRALQLSGRWPFQTDARPFLAGARQPRATTKP